MVLSEARVSDKNGTGTHVDGASNSATPSRPSHETQGKNHSSENEIVRVLQEFGSQVVSIATTTVERDRLVKRVRRSKAELHKANDRKAQNPSSSVAHAKRGEMNHETELKLVEEKLQGHIRLREDTMNALASKLSGGGQHLDTRQLKKESQTASLGTANPASRVNEFKSDVAAGCTESDRTSHNPKGLSSLSKELPAFEHNVLLSNQHDKSPPLVCGIFGRITALENLVGNSRAEVNEMKKKCESTSKSLAALSRSLDEMVRRLDNIELQAKPAVEQSQYRYPELNDIKSDIRNLSLQLENLRNLQESKDEAISDNLDGMQGFIRQHESNLDDLHNRIAAVQHSEKEKPVNEENSTQAPQATDLQQSLWSLSRNYLESTDPQQYATTKQVDGKIASIKETLATHSVNLSVQKTSLKSLETRYNHLSSEPIVRQMVAAMQEMYPFASTAQAEIQNLKESTGTIVRHLNGISLNEIVNKAQGAASESQRVGIAQDILIKEMNTERDQLKSDIAEVDTKIGAAESRLTKDLAILAAELEKVKSGAVEQDSKYNALASTLVQSKADAADLAGLRWEVEEIKNKAANADINLPSGGKNKSTSNDPTGQKHLTGVHIPVNTTLSRNTQQPPRAPRAYFNSQANNYDSDSHVSKKLKRNHSLFNRIQSNGDA